MKAKPFLKWVGGKGQLLSQFENYFPHALRTGRIQTYCEPFLGGGAVFFHVAQHYAIERAYLSDINPDLILTYRVVQKRPQDLLECLQEYQHLYDNTPVEERHTLFLAIREQFNAERCTVDYQTISENGVSRAAQLIFLNKTCFNGLYRTNARGEFNVPFGKYPSPTICDTSTICAASQLLQRAEISQGTYDNCWDKVDTNTFVYFDPPYRPLNQTSRFTTYTGNEFGEQDQIRLAEFFGQLDRQRGGKLMLSNSDPKNTDPNDAFFETHFAGHTIHRVSANRAVNCKGEKRGTIHEIVVTNYAYEPQTLAFDF